MEKSERRLSDQLACPACYRCDATSMWLGRPRGSRTCGNAAACCAKLLCPTFTLRTSRRVSLFSLAPSGSRTFSLGSASLRCSDSEKEPGRCERVPIKALIESRRPRRLRWLWSTDAHPALRWAVEVVAPRATAPVPL
eukprot:scaffold494_cov245-Pinguiococcus_pyrenoidosus.AAC.6